MQVAILDIAQKDLLIGQKYNEDSYFNPIEDADGNWIISIEEIVLNIYSEFDWIKELQLIEYKPIL